MLNREALLKAAATTHFEPVVAEVARPVEAVFETEVATAADAVRYAGDWKDLALRCLEPNIFFEAEFALPALAYLRGGTSARIVFVWERAAAARRLVAVLPIALQRKPLGGLCRAWVHKQAVLGVPLLDRAWAQEACEAMLAAIACAYPRLAVLLLPLIPTKGPTFAVLQKSAARGNRELALFDQHERAVLLAPFNEPLSASAAGELRRQRRRLAESGPLSYRRRQDLDDIQGAMEEFLALEAQGWKGRRKSALAGAPGTAAFARSIPERMGAAGKIAIDSLELAGRAIAMGIVLRSGDRAFFWKIAYDETQAARSPGVLFTQDLTRRQIADAGIAMTDSCARPDHPMINRLWPGRLQLADVAIPLTAARVSVSLALQREKARRALRNILKSIRDRLPVGPQP
jgi:CelD/BcsL family acetyltransferase involved in cellulose biosynthesis